MYQVFLRMYNLCGQWKSACSSKTIQQIFFRSSDGFNGLRAEHHSGTTNFLSGEFNLLSLYRHPQGLLQILLLHFRDSIITFPSSIYSLGYYKPEPKL